MKTIENDIKLVLLDIGKEIKLHKMGTDNYILDINYDKYTIKLMEIFKEYLEN